MSALGRVAIVLVLAAAVWALPGGGQAATLVNSVLAVLFAGGVAFFGGRLYLEHRYSLYGLGDRRRALVYGALALAFLTLAGTPRLTATSAGTLAWLVLLGVAGFALVAMYRFARRY